MWFGTPDEVFPLWTPLGDRLVFQTRVGRGVNSLLQRALSGGEAELLFATAAPSVPNGHRMSDPRRYPHESIWHLQSEIDQLAPSANRS